jgi:hypothetical protein
LSGPATTTAQTTCESGAADGGGSRGDDAVGGG